jgi:hypothetical protein
MFLLVAQYQPEADFLMSSLYIAKNDTPFTALVGVGNVAIPQDSSISLSLSQAPHGAARHATTGLILAQSFKAGTSSETKSKLADV